MRGVGERCAVALQARRIRPGALSLFIAACLALALTTLVVAPAQAHGVTPARASAATYATHALPVSYDPPENAVLHKPPTHVTIVFNELLAADLSKIVVVNPSNQEVDNHDSHINADDYSMTVTLPLLPAGTYVVFWRTHSAQDGHVVSGSYLFHITRADGTVPAFSGPLPTGTFAGGAGTSGNQALTPPTLAGGLARWIALLMITLLLGMIFWSLFVQPRQRLGGDTASALRAGVRARMRLVAWWALWALLVGTLAEVAAQAWLLNGTLSGVISPPLLESILLTSSFGEALTLRLILTIIGLLALWLSRPRPQANAAVSSRTSLFDPRVSLIAFGAFIALAYEFSGHGGSASVWYGSAIDFLHLIANGVWLGGLLTLALVIVPVLHGVEGAARRRYLAASIPAFSIPALIAVAALVVTGPLNATTRLTSVAQVWTTGYGVTLIIKSALFLAMVVISFYHAFVLRPLLSEADASVRAVADITLPGWANRALQRAQTRVASTMQSSMAAGAASGTAGVVRAMELAGARSTTPQEPRASGASGASGASAGADEPREQNADMQPQNQDQRQNGRDDAPRARVERAMLRWWRIEAALGVGVLLCAALLGPLAGTLEASPTATASFGATGGVQTLTNNVDGLSVTMNVNPGKFGTNTFTVTIKNPNGAPANGASVFIVASMVEMDMGDNTINLTSAGTPGVYSGQGSLAMAGHWKLRTVIRTREDPNHLHTTTFTISASY